ncbi:MAG TPA: hypothetical protein VH257_05545, partial [Chloroflexota bacterium]|nr:hypothetical protein [Chloroflexota bacterium]
MTVTRESAATGATGATAATGAEMAGGAQPAPARRNGALGVVAPAGPASQEVVSGEWLRPA